MTNPVRFAFGLHLHQPVGNFDVVFEDHLRQVYRPLLDTLRREECLPLTLHLSGPLLTWLETRAEGRAFLDDIGAMTATGSVELLLSGFDEPILAMLLREDRIEQIMTMRDALHRRFGVDARGLWLTERVWEPDLPAELGRAGVTHVLTDDRHFLVAGHERDELHRPWRTEADGIPITVLPIDERLRYIIPFRPPSEFADTIRTLAAERRPLAILADDGEKFGGWPGTREWVYERGWFPAFGATLRALVADGTLRLVTMAQAVAEVAPAGLTYLPATSYREMEGWSLPTVAAGRLTALERELGPQRMAGPEGALVRGSHWKFFLAKYPESNRMHKKMQRLSRLCRARGDVPTIRRAIGRAQCNDAYWHGVFGGLYLPHLRDGIWSNLALAEQALRRGMPLAHAWEDVDGDGMTELSIAGEQCAVILSGERGGSIEEWTIFRQRRNYADVLTRRREASHLRTEEITEEPTDGIPSIHHLETAGASALLPPVDPLPRAIGVDRLLPDHAAANDFETGLIPVLRTWYGERPQATAVGPGQDSIVARFSWPTLRKEVTIHTDGRVAVSWTWPPCEGWFSTEVSTRPAVSIVAPGADRWEYPVEAVARSEHGIERTIQGTAVVLRWPGHRGEAGMQLAPPDDPSG